MQPAVSAKFTSVGLLSEDSTNCGSKIFGEKNHNCTGHIQTFLVIIPKKMKKKKEKKNYLHSTYMVFKSSRDDVKSTGGCTQALCKHTTILFMGLEHLWICVFERGPETSPL
jgi:hypothetical protein